ncbi:MAG: hypothetical protein M5R40_04745 [Anaerolineae bacterium]|nr:hypothetical protein [Anaerolineae bacterium]
MQVKTQRYAVYVVGLAAWILLLGAVWSQAVAASLPGEYADGLAVRNSLLASQIRDVAGEWYANGEWGRFPCSPGWCASSTWAASTSASPCGSSTARAWRWGCWRSTPTGRTRPARSLGGGRRPG